MTGRILRFLLYGAMGVVITGAFLWTSLKEGLGETTRIIYFHVPVAWITVVFFLLGAYYSYRYLKNRELLYDGYARISNELGLLFCILATLTGSIWARVTWHSFWNWDPRETSIFILLLIYGAYFSLRSAVEQEERKARLSAVYSLLAVVTVPFFIFVIPRIYFSLHPDPVINPQGKINMDASQRLVFFSSLILHTAFFIWMFQVRKMQITLEYILKNYRDKKIEEQ